MGGGNAGGSEMPLADAWKLQTRSAFATEGPLAVWKWARPMLVMLAHIKAQFADRDLHGTP